MAVIALTAAPVFAQTPVANPSSVSFPYTYTQGSPGVQPTPVTVSITDASNAPLSIISTTLTQPSAGAIFVTEVRATSVIVGLNFTVINTSGILTAGGTYSGNLKVAAGSSTVDVPLSFSVNVSSALSSTQLSVFSVLPGNLSTAQTISVTSGGANASFTAAGSTSWIIVSPTVGTTPASLTVYVNASGLGNGTYQGNVVITPTSGTALLVPVTAVVGTGSTSLTLSPNPLSFAYNASTDTPTPKFFTIQTTSGAFSYTAVATTQSGGSWLTFTSNNGLFVGGSFSGGLASVAVQANPSGLTSGITYQGSIQVTASDGTTQTAQVLMTVGSGSTSGVVVSPSTVTFVAPTLNVSPGQQSMSISTAVGGTTSYTASVATFSGGNWLTLNNLTSLSGFLPASFLVGANTFGMAAGFYSGQITITTTGAVTSTQYIPVALTVGSGGGTGTGGTIAPTSLTFAGQAGAANRPGTQYIALGGSGGLYSTAVTTSSGGSGWLTVPTENASGNGPTFIPVSVNTTGLTAGTYTGQVAVTYGGITTNVSVSLSLSTGASVVANPGGIFYNVYTTAPFTLPSAASISMTDGSSPAVTVTPSASWITATLSQNTLPAQLTITVNASSLPGGLNSGSVSVNVAGAANNPLTIPVVINNFASTSGGGTGILTFTPGSIGFSGQVGSTPAAQSIYVASTSFTAFIATPSTTSGGSWLAVTPVSGTAPTTVSVSVNSSGLAAGTYSGSIAFSAGGYTQTVPVTLTIGGGGVTLTFSPTSLSFDVQSGGVAPASQTINVSSSISTSATVATSTSSGGSWLSAAPGAGTTPFNVQVSVNPAGLAAGTYSGTVTVTPSGGTAQTVPVSLTVRANPTVAATPATLTFNYRSGEAAPASQSIQVTAQNSSTPLNFSATAATATGGNWLSVSPASGTTPGTLTVNVTPGSLDPGTYNGTITVAGTGGASGSTTVNVAITVTAPLPTVTRVVNNASYVSGALSPGEIVTIAGSFIGPNDPQIGGIDSATNRIVTTLGGVQVLFNGVPGPVLYVSNNQINAIVPYEVAGRLDTFVQVRFRSTTSNTITLPVTTTVPGVYSLNSSGTGPGAILNQDNSVNGPNNAAAKGSVVVIYATGEGLSQNAAGARPQTGQVVNVASVNDLPRPLLPVAVLIDGQPATVQYAGAAPGQVAGLFQINVVVPPTVNSGNVPVVVSVGSNTSQAGITVTVR